MRALLCRTRMRLSPMKSTILRVLSVDPSSETMTSSSGAICDRIERNCASMNRSPLYVVTQTLFIDLFAPFDVRNR